MASRRASPIQPAKTNRLARQRGSAKAPSAGDRDDWRPGPAAVSQTSPKTILSLQRRYGNRAVQGLIQPKRQTGPVDEPYEREADVQTDLGPAAQLAPGAPPPPAIQPGRPATAATGLALSSGLAAHSALGLIQLKRSLVSSKTTTRKFTGARTENRDNDVKAVNNAPKGVSFAATEPIDVYEGHANITDQAGNIAWYRIQSGKGAGEFVRGTKLLGSLQEGETAGEPGSGPSTSFLDQSNVGMAAVDNNLLDFTRQVSVQGGNTVKLNLGEGATWAGAGLLGMAVSLRDLADDEKGAWDKVNAFIGLMSGIASVQGAAAQIVGNAATQGSTLATQASTTSAWLLSYGDMFSTLTNGIRIIRGVVEVVKMVANGETYDIGKGVQLGTEIVGAALDTARNVLRSIRLVNEALAGGTVGTQFGQIVPGLDIAIAAVKSIQQGYYLVVSAIEMRRMYKRKLDMEAKLREAGHSQEDIKATGKRHRTEDAQSVTLSQLIAQVNAKIVSNEAKRDKIKIEGSDAERQKLTAKREAYDQKLVALKEKRDGLTGRQTGLRTRIEAQEGGDGLKRSDLEERELASDTHIANKRRVTRQGVHISANLVQIAGSIAALVSGPGAPAAVALKLSAAGVDASLPIFRWIKQKGRDMAARNIAHGQTGLANKIFNADKSSAAKQQARHKQAVVILQMVGRLHRLMPEAADAEAVRIDKLARLRERAKYVEGYISATGCPPKKLYAANGDPNQQVKILVEELSKREL